MMRFNGGVVDDDVAARPKSCEDAFASKGESVADVDKVVAVG